MSCKLKILFCLLLGSAFLLPFNSFSQIKNYTFQQIDSLQKIEKRIVMVYIHTDWCKYCQIMQNTTLKNDTITQKINTQLYFVDLNAEEKEDIKFNGHLFKYKPSGLNTGIHELAEQLATMENKISYPTICFLNTKNEIIFQYNQFINATDLSNVLKVLQ